MATSDPGYQHHDQVRQGRASGQHFFGNHPLLRFLSTSTLRHLPSFLPSQLLSPPGVSVFFPKSRTQAKKVFVGRLNLPFGRRATSPGIQDRSGSMIDDQFLGPRVSVIGGRADVPLFMTATKMQKCIENVTQKYIPDIPGAYL